jgi:hypothetical protein
MRRPQGDCDDAAAHGAAGSLTRSRPWTHPLEMSDDTATCADQAQALIRAFNDQAWSRLRTLYHDEALLVTVAGGDAALGPDEAVAAMRRAAKDVVHSIVFDSPTAIDAHAAVVSGSVRSRHADGGFSVTRRGWVVTFEGEKMYRLRVARSLAAARRLYERHGVTLGLSHRTSG